MVPNCRRLYMASGAGTSRPSCLRKKVSDIVHYNLELGVNTFDHSNYTAGGKIEELFGKVVAESAVKREDIVILPKQASVN